MATSKMAPPPVMNQEGPVDIPKNKILGKQWRIKEKLGEGGCGAVYKCINVKTGVSAALKAESNFVAGGPVLKLEVQILRRMKGRKNVAQLLHSGKKETYSYMVMTLLGDNLQKLLCGKICSISTQIRVGIQTLYVIKQLHEVGYIHRDVKPANLALGRRGRDTRIIHLLDFGLAREYVSRSPGKVEMRHPRVNTLFRGTTRYCSANTHTRNEQGRPDDLWSMVYLLVEMRSSLPWERTNDKKEIGKIKIATSDRKLMHNCPVQMLEIAKHLRQLDYYTRPDYLLIYKKFDEVMKAGKYKWSDPYDWEKPSALGTFTKKIMRTLSVSEDAEEDVKEDDASIEQPLISEDTEVTTKKDQKNATKKSMMQSLTTATAKELKETDLFTIADFERDEIGF